MNLTLNKDKMMSTAFTVMAICAVAALLPGDALAQTGTTDVSGNTTSLAAVLCNVINWFQGTIGAGIATIAIIVIGVGALMGKVSWGMAIIVGLGVGIIFGAPTIVAALGGNATCDNAGTSLSGVQ